MLLYKLSTWNWMEICPSCMFLCPTYAMFLLVYYLVKDSEEQVFARPIWMLFPGLSEQRRTLEKISFISGKRSPALLVLHTTWRPAEGSHGVCWDSLKDTDIQLQLMNPGCCCQEPESPSRWGDGQRLCILPGVMQNAWEQQEWHSSVIAVVKFRNMVRSYWAQFSHTEHWSISFHKTEWEKYTT